MNKEEKLKWIVDYITENGWQDTYTEEFVYAYIDECEPEIYEYRMWGAAKVPELNKYLAELYKRGVLRRFPVGLHDWKDNVERVPKWVYGYELAQRAQR